MKLLDIKTPAFGVLTGREFSFGGKSAVLFGHNEKGKTTFIDAVTAALYGPPRASSVFGREYYVRYGAAARALAAVEECGSRLETSSDAPAAPPDFPQELFRALLVIRAGEARIPSQEKRFIEVFTARVLGGGEIDIRRAMNELKKIYVSYERNSWHKRWLEKQDTLFDASRLLQKAGEAEELAQRKLELADELESRRRAAEELEAAAAGLNRQMLHIKLARLKDLQAQMAGALRQISELGRIDRSLYLRYSVAQSEITSLAQKTAEKTALLAEIKRALGENTALKQDIDGKLSLLAAAGLRARLKNAESELSRKEEVWEKFSRKKRAPFSLPALLSGLAGGLAAYAITRLAGLDPLAVGAATAGCALAFYAALLLADIPSPAVSEARKSLSAAAEEFARALEALGAGWRDASRAELRERLSAEDAAEIALTERHDVMETLISRAVSRAGEEESALRQADGRMSALKSQLETELAAIGARDLGDLAARIEKLEYLHRSLDEIESQITVSADITRRSLETDLEKRIREYERRLEGAPPPDRLPPLNEVESAAVRAGQELKRLSAAREQLHREYNTATDRLSRLEGELGMSAAEVFARVKRTENAIAEIARWRRAAEETYQVIAEISRANDEMMKNCVENAAPVFAAMTGIYDALTLVKPTPFEPAAITVRHPKLGERPAEWLSSGARDSLWLSVRMAMAASGYKKPAFMILDEPFLALDSGRSAAALEAAAKFEKDGWQIILLTKDESLAVAAATRGLARIDL